MLNHYSEYRWPLVAPPPSATPISRSMQPEVLVCELCNVRCSNRRELLAHIQGRVHRAEESKLFQDDLELDLTEKQLEQMHL